MNEETNDITNELDKKLQEVLFSDVLNRKQLFFWSISTLSDNLPPLFQLTTKKEIPLNINNFQVQLFKQFIKRNFNFTKNVLKEIIQTKSKELCEILIKIPNFFFNFFNTRKKQRIEGYFRHFQYEKNPNYGSTALEQFMFANRKKYFIYFHLFSLIELINQFLIYLIHFIV